MNHATKTAEIEEPVSAAQKGQRQITIVGTSSLLPGNPAWHFLGTQNRLFFGDFHEWSSSLFSDEILGQRDGVLFLTIFIQDLIPAEKVAELEDRRTDNLDAIRELLAPVFSGIDYFLANASGCALLVAWCSTARSTAVHAAQNVPVWQQIDMQWEAELRERQVRLSSLYLLPMNHFFARAGLDHYLDARNYYSARCRLSQKGLIELAKQAGSILGRMKTAPKKVLALDCDNTLWGGVIGEDGLEGIRLGEDGVGSAYRDFQKVILRLKQQGVLLVLLSKNNADDVRRVFDEHPDMVLRRDDITAARINWQNKAENLKELAAELGLGLDSFVFWDDNALERELLRVALPAVEVPEAPKEVWQWPGWMECCSLFANFKTTKEDAKRGALYESRARFEIASRETKDHSDFLKSIGLCASTVPLAEAMIARAAQLSNKTNQFNLRTARYDIEAIRSIAEDESSLGFMVNLKDKFGDHGNVGLVIATQTSVVRTAFLDAFLLSCRVLGRHLEAWMLRECVNQLRDRDIEILVGEFIPTARNQMAADFLTDHGFTAIEQCDVDLRESLAPLDNGRAGQLFVAKLSEMSIPYLDLFAA